MSEAPDLDDDAIRRKLQPSWKQRINTPAIRASMIRVASASALLMVTVRLLNGRSQRQIEHDKVAKTVSVREQQLQHSKIWIDSLDRRLASSSLSPARRLQVLEAARHVASTNN